MRRFILVAAAAIAILASTLVLGTGTASAAQKCTEVRQNSVHAYVCMDWRYDPNYSDQWRVQKITLYNWDSEKMVGKAERKRDDTGDLWPLPTMGVEGYRYVDWPAPGYRMDSGERWYMQVCIDTAQSTGGVRVTFIKNETPRKYNRGCGMSLR